MSFQVLLKAAMVRHIWAISQKVDTHVEMGTYLCDKKPNIWFMHTPANTSWRLGLSRIYKLRALIQPWLKYVIVDGANTFLWAR